MTCHVSRIKILARLDIAVTRVPQDGRFTIMMDRKEINVRVSTLPTIYGENVVMRLLDMSSGGLKLSDLGMAADDMAKIRSVIDKPHGLFLSTGPTGSGKSTSLFAILREISRPDINIVTLEDPVEYRMDGIRQVQLNRRAGMTFASGLRSILRQDPDVVMVGEIRDAETAGIAVQAALTGPPGAVHGAHQRRGRGRGPDDGHGGGAVFGGLDPGGVLRPASGAPGVPALPGNLCPVPGDAEVWGLEDAGQVEFARGRECIMCGETGYRGRVGIFEILMMDADIAEMIIRRKSAQEITRFAVDNGRLRLLKDDARMKILEGHTTFEEALGAVVV
jgi:type IV pilus assembly protein PilB